MEVKYTIAFKAREELSIEDAKRILDAHIRTVRLVKPGTEPESEIEEIEEVKKEDA